jgi:hypothetical protein
MEPLRAPGIPTRHLAVTYGCGSVPESDRLSLVLAVLVPCANRRTAAKHNTAQDRHLSTSLVITVRFRVVAIPNVFSTVSLPVRAS